MVVGRSAGGAGVGAWVMACAGDGRGQGDPRDAAVARAEERTDVQPGTKRDVRKRGSRSERAGRPRATVGERAEEAAENQGAETPCDEERGRRAAVGRARDAVRGGRGAAGGDRDTVEADHEEVGVGRGEVGAGRGEVGGDRDAVGGGRDEVGAGRDEVGVARGALCGPA